MLSKKIAIATIAGAALLAASGAYARDHHDHRYDGYRGNDRHAYHGHRDHGRSHYRHGPHREVMRPAPVYYAPAPVYYVPAPVYNAPSRPVISGQIPIGRDRNINIDFQL